MQHTGGVKSESKRALGSKGTGGGRRERTKKQTHVDSRKQREKTSLRQDRADSVGFEYTLIVLDPKKAQISFTPRNESEGGDAHIPTAVQDEYSPARTERVSPRPIWVPSEHLLDDYQSRFQSELKSVESRYNEGRGGKEEGRAPLTRGGCQER